MLDDGEEGNQQANVCLDESRLVMPSLQVRGPSTVRVWDYECRGSDGMFCREFSKELRWRIGSCLPADFELNADSLAEEFVSHQMELPTYNTKQESGAKRPKTHMHRSKHQYDQCVLAVMDERVNVMQSDCRAGESKSNSVQLLLIRECRQ